LRNIEDATNEGKKHLISEIGKLEIKLSHAAGLSLRDLLLTNKIDISHLAKDTNDLLKHLITKGYIDESYSDYISTFQEGRITAVEMTYVSCIKKRSTTDNDNITLSNFGEIIAYLHTDDFTSPLLWNTSLIGHLIANGNSEKTNSIISGIKDSMATNIVDSIPWVHKHIESLELIAQNEFLSGLQERRASLYDDISETTSLTLTNKIMLSILVQSIDVNSKITAENLREEIEKSNNIVNSLPVDRESYNQFIELFIALEVRFEAVDISPTEHPFISDIAKNELYVINMTNLSVLAQLTDVSALNSVNVKEVEYPITISDTFAIDDLLFLFSNTQDEVVQRITQAITLLNENDNFTLQTEKSALLLLNDKLLETKIKEEIIKNNKFIVTDITQLEDERLWPHLLRWKRLEVTWGNIFSYAKLTTPRLKGEDATVIKNDSDIFAKFINDDIVNELAAKDNSALDSAKRDDFIEFLLDEYVAIECFAKYIPILEKKYKFTDWDFSMISHEKVGYLIENEFIDASPEIYDVICKHHSSLINIFIEMYFDKYMSWDLEHNVNFSDDVIAYMMKSKQLTQLQKIVTLNNANKNLDAFSNETVTQIIVAGILNQSHPIQFDVLQKIFNSDLRPSTKVLLLTLQMNHFKHENILSLLVEIDDSYNAITTSGSIRPSNTKSNLALFRELEKRDIISSISNIKSDSFRVNMKRKVTGVA